MIFLDTHVVVWLYAKLLGKLSKNAIVHINDNDTYISQMVRLELQYLYEIGRITVTPEVIIKYLGHSIGLKMSLMKVEKIFDHAMGYEWTRDVFDRLITAEADSMSAGLVTKDKNIRDNFKLAVW